MLKQIAKHNNADGKRWLHIYTALLLTAVILVGSTNPKARLFDFTSQRQLSFVLFAQDRTDRRDGMRHIPSRLGERRVRGPNRVGHRMMTAQHHDLHTDGRPRGLERDNRGINRECASVRRKQRDARILRPSDLFLKSDSWMPDIRRVFQAE